MCTTDRMPRDRRPPEKLITDRMRAELGVDIHPTAMRMFIAKNWRLVSAAGHAIHDASVADERANVAANSTPTDAYFPGVPLNEVQRA